MSRLYLSVLCSFALALQVLVNYDPGERVLEGLAAMERLPLSPLNRLLFTKSVSKLVVALLHARFNPDDKLLAFLAAL